MPSNKNTQAAVPFVNQKGERSMKRVRVERYVAGKKPSYAKDEDEDEYYTTDEEDNDQINEYEEDSSKGDDANEEEEEEEEEEEGVNKDNGVKQVDNDDEVEDDDDDPRFRRLKEIASKTPSVPILPPPKKEENLILVDEDEDEEEIRERHRIARERRIEEPLQAQVSFGSTIDDRQNDIGDVFHRPRKEQTEDILKDFKLEGIKPKMKIESDEAAAEERFKDMIESARQQAVFQAQLHKKVEEDRKKDIEIEALNKGGVTGKDLESVNTDDEDEEIAYAEWQFREIKRILRDKHERESETKVR